MLCEDKFQTFGEESVLFEDMLYFENKTFIQNVCLTISHHVKCTDKHFLLLLYLFFITANDDTTENEYYTTIEEQELFSSCFPQLKEEFAVRTEEAASRKGMMNIAIFFYMY